MNDVKSTTTTTNLMALDFIHDKPGEPAHQKHSPIDYSPQHPIKYDTKYLKRIHKADIEITRLA